MKKSLIVAILLTTLFAWSASCGAVPPSPGGNTIASDKADQGEAPPVNTPKVYAESIEALGRAFDEGNAELLEDSLSEDFRIEGILPHMYMQSLHRIFSPLKGRIAKLEVAEEKVTDEGYDLKLEAGSGSFDVSVDKQGKFTALDFFTADRGVSEENRQVNSPLHSLLPFELFGRLVMVEGEINGVEGYLFVDSGAPRCVLNSDVFRNTAGESIESSGVSGPIAGAQMVKVNSLKFGGVEITEFAGQCQPLTHLTKGRRSVTLLGLIGYRELSEFEVLLDYRQKTMRLLKTDARGERLIKVNIPDPGTTVEFEMKEHLPILKCKLDGEELLMALDTGAEATLLDLRLQERFGKLLSNAKAVDLVGAEAKPAMVNYGQLPEFQIDSVTIRNMATLFSDISHLNAGRIGQEVHGIIGVELLARANLAGINFRKKELSLW